ncbi:MAG: PAS domain-containing protein, partial [Acetobacterales bacterium]
MITALLALLALVLAGLGWFGLTQEIRDGGVYASQLTLQFALVVIVVLVFASLAGILLQHFRGLRRLHRTMQMLANRDADWTPRQDQIEGQGAVSALFRGLSRLQDSWRGRTGVSTARLTAILGALSEGVVVVGHDGRVSLVNAGARALFGPRRLRVGSSAYEVLDRGALDTGIKVAGEEGRPVKTEIRATD